MFVKNLIENFKTIVTKKYFCFDGRAGLREFWLWVLMMFVASVIFNIIPKVGMIIGGLWALATLLPTLGVTARRLHDTDKSGWLIALSLIPAIGGLIVLLLCIPEGSAAANRYGEPPTVAAAPPAAE